MKFFYGSILMYILAAVCLPVATIAQCGGERWNVKTGIDADAALVNLNLLTPATIESLVSLPKPKTLPDNKRIQPAETTMWTLSATLIRYVKSYDADYHIVFQDAAGHTMIGEIPDPGCISLSSQFRSGIIHARAQFDAMFTATTTFKTANVPVVITGVGFFDYNEGQEGIAPNGVELHPIVDIAFGPTFSLGSSPQSITAVQGTNPTAIINTTLLNGFNSSLTFSATGLPSGITPSFAPQTLPAPGSGSTTLTLSTAPITPTGTYTVVVSATDGAQTRSTSLTLTITSAGGGTQQILGNPGFEDGSNPSPWAATSGVIDNSNFQTARSGSWKAWLNGFGTAHTDTLMQQVSVPTDITAAKLSFWLHIDSAETTRTKANDTLKVQLRNSTGAVLSTLATYSNLNAAAGYAQLTFDVFAYRGQAVQVYLIGVENGSLKTSFVVDDFGLNVTTSGAVNPDLTLSLSQSSISVTQGSNGNTTITSTVSGGFNSAVTLAVSGVPIGATAGFNPPVIDAPGGGNSTFTLSLTAATPVGTYPVVISASGGGFVRTATLAAIVTASGGPTTQQMLGNPGFENGSSTPAPWVVTNGVINNASTFEAPHSGTWKAWLNGYGSVHTDTLYQTVSIPSTATAATLTFWRHIDTAETTTTTVYDTLKLQIRNPTDTVLTTLATYSNLDAAIGYSQVSFNLLAYKGQTIQIYFAGIEDLTLKTSFVVDDFALNVTTP
ncbi:hypothetical protein BH10ACI2_BH10ACI2_07120 [soil metagenome]